MTKPNEMAGALAERYEFACALARRVGREALHYFEQHGTQGLGTQTKGLQDFVTRADTAAEHTIRTEPARAFRDDGFIGEETGGAPSRARFWVVDPIDGTANYLRGLRHWGGAIAYVQGGKTRLGVVHDAPSDRLYCAALGQGAYRDGQPIRGAPTSDPHSAVGILGTSRKVPLQRYLDQIAALHGAGIEHRRIGSAAIGLLRVAEGVADFYNEDFLNCWDALAAVLIVQQAGGVVRLPPLARSFAHGGPVFGATPALAAQLQALLGVGPDAPG